MVSISSDKPRFLIARLSAIGDTILTIPLLCALRDRYPNAHITWVVEKKSAAVVQGHPDLDQLVVLERLWFKSLRKVLQIRKRLRELRIEVAIDAQNRFKSALACRLSGAPTRIGCRGVHSKEQSTLLNNTLIEPGKPHLVDRTLELLSPLGIVAPTVAFRMPIRPCAAEEIRRFVDASHLGCGFAVINPGAGWESRIWPVERFARVAKSLGERRSLPTVVTWAGERERHMASEIVAGSGGHAMLAPPTSLHELAALLKQSCIYIGNDTGPMHMAVAVDTPCVCLHGPTRPEDSGPYGKLHTPIIERYHAGNSRQRRQAGNEAMRLIGVDQVVRACEEILDRDANQQGAA